MTPPSPPRPDPDDDRAGLHPLLAARWSPRRFDPAATLTRDHLRPLLQAARWAPSAGNTQPARFAVTLRGEPGHARLVEALSRGNRSWAPRAAALLVAVAIEADDEGKPYRWQLHDTGQAVAHLTLQAVAEGLAAHQMAGFDADAVRGLLRLPDTRRPVVVIAVGPLGGPPLDDRLAEREAAPRVRRPLEELLLPVPEAVG